MIGIILPSRGLMFSETAEDILENIEGLPYKFFFSHKKPIPECFEEPTMRALADEDITHLWFVEDDMALKPDTLQNLLEQNIEIATVDYPVTKQGKGAVFYDSSGKVVYFGTGCTLIMRRVFDILKPPYWTSDKVWTPYNYGSAVKFVGKINKQQGYGLHDVNFGIRCFQEEIPVRVAGRAGQRKLTKWGDSGTNNGQHQIEVWRKIIKNYQLKKIQSYPRAKASETNLVTVDTPTGGVTTNKAHADKLVEQGLAEYPPKRYVIIEDRDG